MTRDPELQELIDIDRWKMAPEERALAGKVLIDIAQKHYPSVETLEVRNSDSLDFHNVYVSSIRDALKDAFTAGVTAGMRANGSVS